MGGLATPVTAWAQSGLEARAFKIKAQSLAEAMTDFGDQSGLQVSVNAADVRGRTSASVSGRMTPAKALSQLLAGTGLQFRIDGHIVSLSRASQRVADGTVQLGPLRVEGDRGIPQETGAERDARQADAVYDMDVSSTYAGKEEVERYKGVNTADLLKAMVNVFSGDARNGGAIDPSIRGMQGPGRVPVIIDGTEQALTVWRGYNGASNRSYVDPSLISGLQVLKGPVGVRGVNGSTGGAVVINTLDASDILKPGRNFGVEFRVEGGNNSADPVLPTLLTGQDYRNVPGFPTGFSATYPYGDPSLRVNLRTGDQNDFLSFGDKALRLAVAGRVKGFELFGAYAYRERGNFFSGGNEAGYYRMTEGQLNSDTYVRKLGLNYTPGNEIPNTSSELESWLFKATWNIADDQALQVGFRNSKSKFGEIMPSRIMTAGGGNFGNVQWPLSHVHAQAWNAEYKWQPDSKWIDLKANFWLTHTVSDTYSSGGFPNTASVAEPIIINNAVANSRNNRYGLTASNQFKLTPRLDLLLDGNWQHEKLGTDDQYTPAASRGWRQLPRQGRREEYRISLKSEWRPVSFLKFNAGLTWSGYWTDDDFLPQYISLHQQESGRPLGQNVI
ncbi:MAG: secretin and TonB N-terminal domain-containing protein, partial [Sphingobium sp.]